MVIYKKAAGPGEELEIKPKIYKSNKSYVNMATDMASLKDTFEIIKDEDGYLCAADMEQGIFTDGRDEDELIRNINDTIECHFGVPQGKVTITYKKPENNLN